MNLRSVSRLHSYEKQGKVYALVFVGIFLSFILLTAVSVYTVKKMTERGIQESNHVISQVIKDHLKESIIKPLINSNSIAKDDYLVDLLFNENSESEKSIKSYLRGIKNGYGYDFCYVVSDKTKKYYSSNGLKKIISPESNEIDKWYTRFLSKNKDLDLVVEREEISSDKLTIFFDNRITDKTGKFLGVTGVAIHLEQLQNAIKFLENKFDVQISLVDRDGNIIESDLEKMANIIVEGVESGININSDFLADDNNQLYKNPRIILNTKLFLVVKNKKSGENDLFLKVIFVNSLLCIFITLLITFIIQFLLFKANSLSLEVMKDTLTKAYNKKAYDTDSVTLKTDKVPELCSILVDINGLKNINNTFGHERGDYLIKGLYECLESVFAKKGFIYRISGDKFSVFLSISLFELDIKLIELNRLIEIWSKVNDHELSVCIGFSSRVTYPYMTVDDLVRNAEEMLIKKKQEYYAHKECKKQPQA